MEPSSMKPEPTGTTRDEPPVQNFYGSDSEDSTSAPVTVRIDGRPSSSGEVAVDRWVATAARPRPRLSWTVPLVRAGQQQSAYEVRLIPDGAPDNLFAEYSSGTVLTADPWHVVDRPLLPDLVYRWSVRVRDENARWSAWAEESVLETGPWQLQDWEAEWVSVPPLQVVRIPFVLPRPARRARLHLTAQGLVRACVDATPVNAGSLDPSRTDPDRALYRTYDVTDLCSAGEHSLDLTVARGAWAATAHAPRVLASCVVILDDGTVHRFGTGDGLLTTASVVTEEQPFYLERHDLRLIHRFTSTGAARAAHPRDRKYGEDPSHPPRAVSPDPGPLVRTVATLDPTLISSTDERMVFDVGTNIAGRARLRLTGPCVAGTVVRLVHGEHLSGDGGVDTTNLTLPHDRGRTRQVVEFVLDDSTDTELEAWFSYAGFRYVQVEGVPSGVAVKVEAVSLHSDLPTVSTLDTDAEVVNRLAIRARRTLLNNVHGIPEDCPTREQAGWTGDTASVTEFEFAAFDMEGFFAKWLGDLRTSQRLDGAVPAIAPSLHGEPTLPDPVWGAALQRVLLGHWLHYGDRQVLEENLPALRRWTQWLSSCVGNRGVVDGAPISYGHDWLGLQQTPPELHHTAATIDAFEVLARLEGDLRHDQEAADARTVADELRAAARSVFVDDRRRVVANGSQGSLAIALDAGILAEQDRGWAQEALVASVHAAGNRVTSGFATTRTVVRALTGTGHDQVLLDVLAQSQEPGIGAMVASDLGTLWECWWVDPLNTGTGSLDHVGLGGPFATWAWRHLAGLRPVSAGFRRFEVDPRPVTGVNELRLSMSTVRGTVDVSWSRTDEQLELNLVVPVSSTAVILSPDGPLELTAGHHRIHLRQPHERPVPPGPERPWQAPVRAPRSADVDLEPLDLARLDTTALENSEILLLPDGLQCMPVPHEQEPGPGLRVTGAPNSRTALVRLGIGDHADTHLDLTDATFCYARLDLCEAATRSVLESVLTVHADDGTSITKTGKVWPAGWNRVAVDLSQWPGRHRITGLTAGVHVQADTEPADDHAPSVVLGAAGFSRGRRTW